tara:strand:- start:2 stop:175 length:174 start_codon:yes stop_codon:yes gene_type:complete
MALRADDPALGLRSAILHSRYLGVRHIPHRSALGLSSHPFGLGALPVADVGHLLLVV